MLSLDPSSRCRLAIGPFFAPIVRAVLHDHPGRSSAVGLFVGAFAYSMTVLREVNGNSSAAGVPGLAIIVDCTLILSAIVVLVLYVHHTTESIRVGGLIGWVADATREEVDHLYPAPPEPGRSGVVAAHRCGSSPGAAERPWRSPRRPAGAGAGARDIGDFCPAGGPLFRCCGSLPEPHRSAAARSVILDRERGRQFEPAFGLRRLVDVGARDIY